MKASASRTSRAQRVAQRIISDVILMVTGGALVAVITKLATALHLFGVLR
jgi:hypothetical protein